MRASTTIAILLAGTVWSPKLQAVAQDSQFELDQSLDANGIGSPGELEMLPTPTSVSKPARAITITDDWGGGNAPYMFAVEQAKMNETPVRFEGPCKSACTFFLSLPSNLLCATGNAAFHFHKSFGAVIEGEDEQFNKRLMTEIYPIWVREWLVERGGLTSDWLVMPSSYVLQHIKKCPALGSKSTN